MHPLNLKDNLEILGKEIAYLAKQSTQFFFKNLHIFDLFKSN